MAPSRPEWANSPKVHLIILEGFGESMSPGILGFSLLALVALECAVGMRRSASRVSERSGRVVDER